MFITLADSEGGGARKERAPVHLFKIFMQFFGGKLTKIIG